MTKRPRLRQLPASTDWSTQVTRAGVKLDMVGLNTVTDDTGTGDTEDISLKRTRWSNVPPFTLGIRLHP